MVFHLQCFGVDMISLDNDLVLMFDEAFKMQPSNEDLGIQTFVANVRASNWKSAHQVCQHIKVENTHSELSFFFFEDCDSNV